MNNQVTKKNLDALENKIDGKFNKLEHKFEGLEHKFNKLEQKLDKKFEEVMYHFDAVAENIHLDVAGANADEISLIKQKQDNLETRVSTLEEKVGS